jgi:hypothetical protein
MYGRILTKEELMDYGINEVTKTGRVFRHGEEVKPTIDNQGYFMYRIYDKDENGNKIKIMRPDATKDYHYTYKTRAIGLHRLMWAWHYGECPEGMVVDHKSNRHTHIEDYYLSNLQLLTPAENVAKERDNWHVWELKCDLSKPRSHFEQKLEGYTLAYENAKANKDAEGAHKLRSSVCQTRARLRYYDSHIDEYVGKQIRAKAEKKVANDCHARAQKRRELQYEVDYSRKFYQDLLEAYGKDDPIVTQYYYEWKMAIAKLKMFKEECKRAKESSAKL